MANRYKLIHSGSQVTGLAATASGDKDKYLHSNSSTGALEWGTVSAGTVEGTAVLSTGEAGGTKFLREDGDGTCSWQAASFTLADNTVSAGKMTGASATKLANGSAGNLLKSLGDGTFGWDTSTYLTAVTAHNLLSTTHGDTLADTVVRGDILIGNSTPKWARLAFPATPTGKVLIASATDITWSANPLGTAAYAATGDFLAVGGTAAKATILETTRAIYGNNFDGSAALTGIIASAYGGTGNGFTKFTGATTSEKTYTLPNSSETLLYSGGALGTPASGTVTNLTGTASININGTVGATTPTTGKFTSVETTGDIELGHATDTTISRSAAGVIAVEGVVIPSISSTNTLTNKRITQRVVTTTDDATAEINVDVTDQYQLTAIANDTTFTTTGTPTNGQKLIIRLKDAGTAKALTWNSVFRAIGVTLPTTTVANKTHYVGCVYNSAATKWDVLAVSVEA